MLAEAESPVVFFVEAFRAPGTHLVLVENSVANPGHEHHRDQEWDETAARHDVLVVKNEGR